jgi:hypothetical protein
MSDAPNYQIRRLKDLGTIASNTDGPALVAVKLDSRIGALRVRRLSAPRRL